MHALDDLDRTASCHRFPAWLFALLLLGCHDAPRENPFDPELTPAVGLSVTLDEGMGRVELEWTRYAGEVAFAEYRVLRETQTVLKNGFPGRYTIKYWSPSRAVAIARGADGERLLSFIAPFSNLYGVFEISPDGEFVWWEEKIFAGELVPPADEEGRYRGGVGTGRQDL